MKIVLFSDLHIFAHLSRTQFEDIAQAFLIRLLNYCRKNQINKIFFLGDWFHIKNKLYVPPFIKSIDLLRAFREEKIDLTFLIGNHDAPQMHSTDHSIMYAFQEYGKVVPLYDWQDIEGIRFHFLSYTNELPEFEYAEKNVLMAHLDVKNFVMDSGFICQEGFDSKMFEKFDYVFSGHFHKHQIINNIVYVGSPYQTRFSERFDEKGFIVLDTSDLNWQFIKYPKAPKFKEINLEEYDEKQVKGNFVRIKTHKNSNLTEIKDKFLALGAETVDFIFEDENEEKELTMIEDLTMGSMTELSSAYFDMVAENKLFPKELQDLLQEKKVDKNYFVGVFKDIEEANLSGWKPEEE